MSYSPSRMNMGQQGKSGRGPEEAEHGMLDEAYEKVGQAYETAEQCVKDYPTTAVAVTFAAGMALGFLLVQALSRPAPQPVYSRMGRFGRRTMDAISNVLPDAVTSRLHM